MSRITAEYDIFLHRYMVRKQNARIFQRFLGLHVPRASVANGFENELQEIEYQVEKVTAFGI